MKSSPWTKNTSCGTENAFLYIKKMKWRTARVSGTTNILKNEQNSPGDPQGCFVSIIID